VPSSIPCTAVLDVRRETAGHLAMMLRGHRDRLGTRRGTRVPGVFKQAVLVLRWSVDGARLVQLAPRQRHLAAHDLSLPARDTGSAGPIRPLPNRGWSSGRLRKAATCSSRWRASAETCDFDSCVTPRDSASFSTRRALNTGSQKPGQTPGSGRTRTPSPWTQPGEASIAGQITLNQGNELRSSFHSLRPYHSGTP